MDALQGEVEEESLAASSAIGEAMNIMLRLQREKPDVQMELCQFCRPANQKMALGTTEVNHLPELIARRCAAARTRLLHALEADREFMRQALVSMCIDKAQLIKLLREIVGLTLFLLFFT